MLELEVKLPFDTVEAARSIVAPLGSVVEARRLIEDRLFDSPDGRLAQAGASLRLRRDGDRARLTVKGPVVPASVKAREEFETPVSDAAVAEAMLTVLGFRPTFRAEKYREEYLVGGAHVAIDETPLGVFVEVEGSEVEIERVTRLLGRTTDDYCLDSYVALWRRRCLDRGEFRPVDMTFEHRAVG